MPRLKEFILSSIIGTTGVLANPLWASGQMDFFGITVRWQGENPHHESQIKEQLIKLSLEGKFYFDPDCRWRPLSAQGVCENEYPKQTQELTQLAEEYKQETLGYFDVFYDKKLSAKPKRDFGGLWQGYSLQKIKESISGNWILDFSGDIYSSDTQNIEAPISISDPLFDSINYAQVKINRGFVLASVAKDLGGKIQLPTTIPEATGEDDSNDILKIVLFATPPFDGARLDAWTTAIIAGGKKTLDHLWELEEYKNQWAYFYFSSDGTPECSKNIECNLKGKNKTVRVNF